ncbi:helix-turn-helix domain-containing protein [Amphiplicatus metriothermophilus]|uniref:Transcriptional regulator, contains XRE-family HTH domain n=1 Tax=Amphiplicatus metriothermophilus TaxID=1519374 RepID=A0A239PSQ2_9PROT|nr:helix-turn-helix transcriptional regulator [Amphiplicatus metriothermophilus]MBB5519120.1 transcriptional regulator with XRE-family HTH domain [Amphiplicatus metriothermophilus]SNT73190.1 Transcriptional regulator, contains XRE-family HTH domain [Amphiplicatus metriothermophilus]
MRDFLTFDSPATIGERIRLARKASGLNQAALAERIGVTQPAVANWESGVHDPRRLMLARLAEALAVPLDWLAGGARSTHERDTHPAAAYLRRPIHHTPVISFRDAARFIDDTSPDPHSMAEDYIPVTTAIHKAFALFISDEAVDLAFPKDTLVVIDYMDRRPTDGAFCLAAPFNFPILRRWRESPPRLEPQSSDPAHKTIMLDHDPKIIGCARVSIRIH